MENNKRRFVSKKLLMFLAVGSFLAAVFEGILYYRYSNVFFNALLILQNGINAFMFKPSISLSDAMQFLDQNRDVLHSAAGYMYGVAVFTAPYCTVAAVYRVLENLLRVIFRFRKHKSREHIIIFGFNKDSIAMLGGCTEESLSKRCVHLISSEELTADQKYTLGRRGIFVHCFELLNTDERELAVMLKKAQADIAGSIILFDESPITNFSLLQIFSCREGDGKFRLRSDAKITCRCDDDSIAELIADYYEGAGGEKCLYELETVSIPELQVRKMFETVPLHSFYYESQKPLREWDIRVLILGFGALGRQALIQTAELGAVHKSNRIEIDVYDTDIERKAELFANRLSAEAFEVDGNTVKLRSGIADGELKVNCCKLDVTFKSFIERIRAENEIRPYTYVFITIDDIGEAVSCALRLSKLLGGNVPIVLRMDSDRRLADYVNGSSGTLSSVKLLEDREQVLSLDYILAKELDRAAKQFNYFYSTIQVVEKGGAPYASNSSDADELWRRNTMFRRRSSKALASHEPIKQVMFERLASELGLDSADAKINELIGSSGSLMSCNGSTWQLNDTTDGFLAALEADSFASSVASAEHRRWCCFTALDGWHYGSQRNNALKIHNCLMPYDRLLEDKAGRETVVYDLMSMMARYKISQTEQREGS